MLGVTFQVSVSSVNALTLGSKADPGSSEGLAAWYSVPRDSLARRRAGPDEFTAAHNGLPLGTRVRVTRISNGRDVIVRITDRGIKDRRATIDLCKEAAVHLGMIRAGFSRVRIEIISETTSQSSADDDSSGSR